jgi:hypothetical protein
MGLSNRSPAPWQDGIARKELAVGITATLFFFLSVLIVPMMGIFVGIFTPLPTLVYFYRWGAPIGCLVPGGAGLIGCLLLWYLGAAHGIPYLLGMLGLGLYLGSGMRKGLSAEVLVGTSSLIILSMGALLFW